MSGCDVSSFGGGFVSKKNKQSVRIDVKDLGGELSYNVKDKKGQIIETRTFKEGDHAIVFRGLKPKQEITEKMAETADERQNYQIQGFWTVLDGKTADALGAELKTKHGLIRLPLRILLPMENPNPKPTRDPEEL